MSAPLDHDPTTGTPPGQGKGKLAIADGPAELKPGAPVTATRRPLRAVTGNAPPRSASSGKRAPGQQSRALNGPAPMRIQTPEPTETRAQKSKAGKRAKNTPEPLRRLSMAALPEVPGPGTSGNTPGTLEIRGAALTPKNLGLSPLPSVSAASPVTLILATECAGPDPARHTLLSVSLLAYEEGAVTEELRLLLRSPEYTAHPAWLCAPEGEETAEDHARRDLAAHHQKALASRHVSQEILAFVLRHTRIIRTSAAGQTQAGEETSAKPGGKRARAGAPMHSAHLPQVLTQHPLLAGSGLSASLAAMGAVRLAELGRLPGQIEIAGLASMIGAEVLNTGSAQARAYSALELWKTVQKRLQGR